MVGVFPDRKAITRLVGAVLGEFNNEWMITQRAMSVGALEEAQSTVDNHSSTSELDARDEPLLLAERLVW